MSRPIICIGAALIDELIRVKEILPGTTSESSINRKAGGVGRNIAHQLALLDVPVLLISVFGNDQDGAWLRQVCEDAGVWLEASIVREGYSGKYTGILNPDGSLFTAFLINNPSQLITPDYLKSKTE